MNLKEKVITKYTSIAVLCERAMPWGTSLNVNFYQLPFTVDSCGVSFLEKWRQCIFKTCPCDTVS